MRLRALRLPRPIVLRLLYFGTVFVAISALLLVYPAVDPGLAEAWERTIESQLDRESPFSIWGQVSWLDPVQTLLVIGTVAGAAALALVPRKRNLLQICALSAAVIIATEMTLEHWFYTYIPWFFGMLMAAIATGGDAEADREAPRERRLRRARAAPDGTGEPSPPREPSMPGFHWPTRRPTPGAGG